MTSLSDELSQGRSGSVIIEAAINGQTMVETNPQVPRTSAELASDALACLAAGAAIVHSHITDITVAPDRAASLYLEHFRPICSVSIRLGARFSRQRKRLRQSSGCRDEPWGARLFAGRRDLAFSHLLQPQQVEGSGTLHCLAKRPQW